MAEGAHVSLTTSERTEWQVRMRGQRQGGWRDGWGGRVGWESGEGEGGGRGEESACASFGADFDFPSCTGLALPLPRPPRPAHLPLPLTQLPPHLSLPPSPPASSPPKPTNRLHPRSHVARRAQEAVQQGQPGHSLPLPFTHPAILPALTPHSCFQYLSETVGAAEATALDPEFSSMEKVRRHSCHSAYLSLYTTYTPFFLVRPLNFLQSPASYISERVFNLWRLDGICDSQGVVCHL